MWVRERRWWNGERERDRDRDRVRVRSSGILRSIGNLSSPFERKMRTSIWLLTWLLRSSTVHNRGINEYLWNNEVASDLMPSFDLILIISF